MLPFIAVKILFLCMRVCVYVFVCVSKLSEPTEPHYNNWPKFVPIQGHSKEQVGCSISSGCRVSSPSQYEALMWRQALGNNGIETDQAEQAVQNIAQKNSHHFCQLM